MYCQLDSFAPPLTLSSKTIEGIRENWQRFTNWRPTNEKATLCRLVRVDDNILHAATDVTYKEVVGLRFRQVIDEASVPFQVITALALVYTSDNHFILIPRDSGDWEPALECPGGFVRASYFTNDTISIKDFITLRVMDDMKLTQQDIATTHYHTTYDAKSILEYMLVYKITLNLSKNSLISRHPKFVFMPPEYTPDIHHHFTKQLLHPPSKGALLLTHHLEL